MADRSRSPLREGKFWWVRVQDRRPIKVFATELGEQQDVDDLISVARRKSELHVAADKMRLYKNADACDVEDSDVSVNEILPDGNSVGKPILIVFDAPEASAQASEVAKLRGRIAQLEQQAATNTDSVSSFAGEASVRFSTSTKNNCWSAYSECCAFCGTQYQQHSTVLSVAHIATHHSSQFDAPPKGKKFERAFYYDDVRNSLLLCHGFAGSCHQEFDNKRITVVPHAFDSSGVWAVLCGPTTSWFLASEAIEGKPLRKFPPHAKFHIMNKDILPYRRALGLRYRAFLSTVKVTSEKCLEIAETITELSALASSEEVDEASEAPPCKRVRRQNS